MKVAALIVCFVAGALALAPTPPKTPRQIRPGPDDKAGEALFLTPYIESGDFQTGQALAKVVDPLDGVGAEAFESYSGFITTNAGTNSNMYFWFCPSMVFYGAFKEKT